MNYGQIYDCDTANGPGIRVSLFVSGCSHHCKGCFNPDTWDFKYGQEFTSITIKEIIGKLNKDHITGLTILGGEPMEPENQFAIFDLLNKMRLVKLNKSIWMYSGYTFEELLDTSNRVHTRWTEEILSKLDVLVDGEFILEQKNISLPFRGSSNQRILNVKKSLRENSPIWVDKFKV